MKQYVLIDLQISATRVTVQIRCHTLILSVLMLEIFTYISYLKIDSNVPVSNSVHWKTSTCYDDMYLLSN